ncbi:MAG: PAS domain S-box protein [Polyangia bacterium]
MIEKRLRFETLLSDLSAALLSSRPEDLPAQIALWLERTVESLRIDRASIFRIEPDSGTVTVANLHVRSGSPAQRVDPRELTAMPWYTSRILRGERLELTSLPDCLPPEAVGERAFCLEQGLTSHLAIPLQIGGRLLGTLGVSSFEPGYVWPEALIQRMQLLAQIFANALHRQHTELALKRNQTRLQLALDAASVGIWEWDIAQDRVSWSPNVPAMYGLGPGAAPENHEAYALLTHPDDRPMVQQRIADCRAGRIDEIRAEHRVLWPDGSMHWVESRAKIQRGEGGEPQRLIGTVMDITERKRAEMQARESHRMYEALVNSIDGIVWEVDVTSFRFTYVSPQAERILGYPVEHWYEPGFWLRHMHDGDRGWAADFCRSATREKRDHEFQYRMVAADGREVWVHDVVSVVVEDGQPSKLRGVMVDITERKKVEEALRESESHFRAVFEEAPIGLAYIDRSLRIGRVNRSLCSFLGRTAEELQGKAIAEITHPDDIERDGALAQQLFLGEIGSYQLEKRYLHKSGEIAWGLLTATVIRDKDGQIAHGLGMIENITGRKEAEDQLRHAQKMEALGRLAGGVAHDFNNLLTAIKGYSEISLSQLPREHWLRGNLEEIIQAGDRATALTRQLLAFGRKQVRRPKLIDLSFTVDEMQRMLRRLIGENIKLTTSIESKLGTVLADPNQVEQILVNLVVNARDAMPRGGKLTIELANVYLDAEYARHHRDVTPGPYVMLAVSDTGVGMSRDVQQRIFEPFFTTKEPGMGTGLGLPMVYGIVKQSEGHIWVYSEPGVGTTFKIYLPCSGQPADVPEPRPPRPSESECEAPGGTASILVVEDDDSVRNMLLRILRENGYSLVAARDGQEALQLCEQGERRFDLLLTDVIMPKMGGRELSEKLKRLRPDLKVLYLSGYAHDAMVHNGALDRGVALLEKPFTKAELLHKIREVLGRA